ncbi:MFS transporter [Pseudonocardia phyllosphaerae]|uniref:MFS transporter n=1 Tax=Pseudonocardia phyllosphaerae TaxID=3390502 RepID=UPI003978F7A5
MHALRVPRPRIRRPRIQRPRIHRAWWVAAVVALVIVTEGWSTGVPNMLTEPVLAQLGWSRGVLGTAFAINMALYGLTAPFAAAAMDRFGIRPVALLALALVVAGALVTTTMSLPAQLILGWGLLVGLGTGALSLTFGAVVTERWFHARRGLVSGVLTSSSMFGGMVLMPLLAWVMHHHGWRAGVATVGGASLLLVLPVLLVVRDHPASVGTRPYGATGFVPPPARADGGLGRALVVLRRALATRAFWLLALTFGVCGASTNGVMMTHFVPAAGEVGMPTVVAAGLLAVMGVCNVVGAAASGWLTDRYGPVLLLVGYYGARAVSLVLLPSVLGPGAGTAAVGFAVAYGLLDLATVPPTIALCRTYFGPGNGPIVFGWVSAVHALGAASAAYLGSVGREVSGGYDAVWYVSGVACVGAAVLALGLRAGREPAPIAR